MKSTRSQSAFEFVMMLCFVFFFFILFYTAIQESTADKIKEKNDLALKNMVLDVKNEIDLAYSASDGYGREFNIPSSLGGIAYNISIISGMIYAYSERSSLAVPIAQVNGSLKIGLNIIRKQNNSVYLNP